MKGSFFRGGDISMDINMMPTCRIWDEEHKIMEREVLAIDFDQSFVTVYSDYGREPGIDYVQFINCVFLKFSGLLDKHDQEIFEGDIIQNDHGAYGVVVFKDGCFMIKLSTPQELYYSIADTVEDIEVIGNIYENPEIVEEIRYKRGAR